MFREFTFSEVNRAETREAVTDFVMDEESFRAFYDRNARGLWLYLSRVTGDPQAADDLLQETFYRFLRAQATHESDAHRRNSLYRIATNLARDSRRRRETRPGASVTGHDIESLAGSAHAPEPERATDFDRAMALLKPRERAMLWLAYAEGATHREIADALDLQPASLKLLLFRARRKLAELLGRAPANEKRLGNAR